MTEKKETVGDAGVTRALKEVTVLANLVFIKARKGTLSHGRPLDPTRVNFKVFRDRMGVTPSQKL